MADKECEETAISFSNPISLYVPITDGSAIQQQKLIPPNSSVYDPAFNAFNLGVELPQHIQSASHHQKTLQQHNTQPYHQQAWPNQTLQAQHPTFIEAPSTANKVLPIFEGQSFPFRLWYLVNHEFYDDVIKWSDDGNYVIITSEGRFEDKVLIEPRDRIFKTTSMKSFIRQLNLYGFHKVQLDKDKNFSHLNVKDKASWPETVFAHSSFKRSRQELLEQVRRRCKVKQHKQTKAQGFPVESYPSTSSVSNPKKRRNMFLEYSNMVASSSASNQQQSSTQLQESQSENLQQTYNPSASEIMMQYPNLLPQPEQFLTAGRDAMMATTSAQRLSPASSVKRNLQAIDWGNISNINNSSTSTTNEDASPRFDCQINQLQSPSTNRQVSLREKTSHLTTPPCLPPAAEQSLLDSSMSKENLNPLADFCASLFYPNKENELGCDD